MFSECMYVEICHLFFICIVLVNCCQMQTFGSLIDLAQTLSTETTESAALRLRKFKIDFNVRADCK